MRSGEIGFWKVCVWARTAIFAGVAGFVERRNIGSDQELSSRHYFLRQERIKADVTDSRGYPGGAVTPFTGTTPTRDILFSARDARDQPGCLRK